MIVAKVGWEVDVISQSKIFPSLVITASFGLAGSNLISIKSAWVVLSRVLSTFWPAISHSKTVPLPTARIFRSGETANTAFLESENPSRCSFIVNESTTGMSGSASVTCNVCRSISFDLSCENSTRIFSSFGINAIVFAAFLKEKVCRF